MRGTLCTLSERILYRALCALRALCRPLLRGLLRLLSESTLRRPFAAVPDRTDSQAFALLLDPFSGSDDSLFPGIRLILLVHGSLSFTVF